MADTRDKPSGRPINADTKTPIPDRHPGARPLLEDYGGPRRASDGERVTPDTSTPESPVKPQPPDGGVEPGATSENFGAPTHSRADAEGQE